MDFENLKSGGYAAIEKLVSEGTEESHRLDFKLKSDPSRPDLQREDRKALGEAASGFANAVGGVLVVGVETEDCGGIDRAKIIRPINDVTSVADRYASYLSECVTPPVEGSQVIAVTKDGSTSGVILISIPKGNARPHMSIAQGHHRFYRRTADRFQMMERYEVEEMFRLKDSPKLELILDYQSGGSLGGNAKTFIRFGLRNLSNISAKFPYISVRKNANAPKVAQYGLDGNGRTLFEKLVTGPSDETLFSGGSDIVLHPSQSLFVSRLEYIHDLDERMRHWSASSLGPNGTCAIDFSFGCEDCPRQDVRVVFTSSNLLNHEAPSLSVI